MARPKKEKPIEAIDLSRVKALAADAYAELCADREGSDFSGHDYAYKAGYVKAALEQMLKELGDL
jgi:hypothetical protein